MFDPRAADAVIDWPASAFAQTATSLLQRIRGAARGPGAAVITVTAPEWGAKTAVAVALARAASSARLRVAIIDADLTHPAVAHAMRLGPARAGMTMEREGLMASDPCRLCGGVGWVIESADGRKQAHPCVCRGATIARAPA